MRGMGCRSCATRSADQVAALGNSLLGLSQRIPVASQRRHPGGRSCRFLVRGVPLLLICGVVLQPADRDLGVRSDPLNEDFVGNNRSPRGRHHMESRGFSGSLARHLGNTVLDMYGQHRFSLDRSGMKNIPAEGGYSFRVTGVCARHRKPYTCRFVLCAAGGRSVAIVSVPPAAQQRHPDRRYVAVEVTSGSRRGERRIAADAE